MCILNITVDLISQSIIEIHGQVDFELLKQFENHWMGDEFEIFREYTKKESEWCELILTFVPDETLDGRVTASAYYNYEILEEGIY